MNVCDIFDFAREDEEMRPNGTKIAILSSFSESKYFYLSKKYAFYK